MLSQVTVEAKPAHTLFLAEWPQPWLNGDDGLDWYVTSGSTTRKVQRDRLTDEVYWCSALVDGTGISSFNVDTGPATSPATSWTTPTLTGLGMRWTWAHDSSVHFADFTDTTTQDILRDGHNTRTLRRYMLSKVSTVGTSNLVLGEGVLCHHVLLTYRADLPDVVKLDIRMSNAAGEVQTDAASLAARGGGIKSTGTTQLNTIGFSDCDLILPAGWACIQDRTVSGFNPEQIVDATTIPPVAGSVTSNAHCFPRKMATRRRFVIYKTATATLQQAQDALAFKGFGRAVFSPRDPSWRSYHTVNSFGPSKSRLPRADLGYPGGYAQLKSECDAKTASLRSSVAAGTATFSGGSGDFGSSTTARFGLFQFVGSDDPQEPGGSDIGTFCGGQHHVPAYIPFATLYGSLKLDGCGLHLYERTTGKPLRSYDFATGYAGGSVPNFEHGAQFAGIRQPFSFLGQNNGGYETRGGQQEWMAGWTKRDDSWPPHFRADSAWTSAGFFWMEGKWWPQRTSLWGTAPRSNWDFICNYRPLLEYVPYSTAPDAAEFHGQPIFGRSTDPNTPGSNATKAHLESAPTLTGTGTGVCWKDPEDNQHACRIYRSQIALAWLAGDLMSIDDISMIGEWFGLEYSEMGMLRRNDTDNAFVVGTTNKCLGPGLTGASAIDGVAIGSGQTTGTQGRLAIQKSASNTARYGMGRGDAWVATIFAADFALATSARRSNGGLVYGLTARARMMFEFVRAGVITANGMTARLHGSDITGITQPYVPTGNITTNFACMQTSQELPKLYFGYFSLFKQLQGSLTATGIADITSNMTVVAGPTGFLNGVYSDYWPTGSPPANGQYAPFDFLATWNDTTNQPVLGNVALGGFFHSGGHWSECGALVEFAYRLSGDQALFQIANKLGPPVARGTAPQTRATFWMNSEPFYSCGLAAVMQSLPGADAGFTPPQTNPTCIVTLAPNPIVQGATLTITAVVTPGTNPTSSGVVCTVNLGEIGGPVAQAMTSGDGITFTTTFDTTGAILGLHTIAVNVLDAELRFGLGNAPITVTSAATAPSIRCTTSPHPVQAGTALTFNAVVVAGTSPASSGLAVTVDLVKIGGSTTFALVDGGGGNWSGAYTVPAATEIGDYSIRVTVSDAQLRSGLVDVPVTVSAAPVPSVAPKLALRSSKNPVNVGDTVTFTAQVTLGATPLISSVEADLSALGGAANTAMLDDGIAPDAVALDLIYTCSLVIGAVPAGNVRIGAVVADKLGGVGSSRISMTVLPTVVATNPTIVASASPNPIVQQSSTVLRVVVTPGTAPASSGIAVKVNLTALGGSATQALADQGGNVWTYTLATTLANAAGSYTLTFTMTDAQARTATYAIILTILPFVPTTTTTVYLPVKTGRRITPVPTDAAERLKVGTVEIENTPPVPASVGGHLPVTTLDGIVPVPFVVNITTPPPVVVVIGAPSGHERRAAPVERSRAR